MAVGLCCVVRLGSRVQLPSAAHQEGVVARGLLGMPHLQGLLRLQVQRDRDGWQDADVPEGGQGEQLGSDTRGHVTGEPWRVSGCFQCVTSAALN